MYSEKLERIMKMAVSDGVITSKERAVIYNIAAAEGVSSDEIDIVLDAMIYEKNKDSAPVGDKLNSELPPPIPQNTSSTKSAGEIREERKCVFCGAYIDPTLAICPACGNSVEGRGGASSVKQLMDMLDSIGVDNQFLVMVLGYQKANKKAELIRNFPVPTSKGDIIEFLLISLPYAKKKGFSLMEERDEAIVRKAWKHKFEQILVKARISLAGDPDGLAQVDAIEAEYRNKKRKF